MGLFDSTDWSDPANAAQMAFAANLMSSGKGLFPAYGDALKAAPGAAAQAQAYKSNQLGIADNVAKLQAWLGKTNHFRRQANMPDLTLNDLIKGDYSLLPASQKQGALQASGAATPPDPSAPSSPAVIPASASGSLFSGNITPALQTTESGNNPNAVSPAGAQGLMQVMPATAKDPGFGVTPSNGTPADTKRVGDQYFQALEKKYGNAAHALVAYNWGPGNTDKWLAAGGDPNKIPKETQGEIAKVALQMAKGGAASPVSAPQNVDASIVGQPSASTQGAPNAIPSDLGLYDPDQAIANAEKQVHTLSPQETAAQGLPAGSFAQQDAFGKVDANPLGAISPEALKQQEALWGVKSGMGEIAPPSGQPSQSGDTPVALHGADFLKTINPQLATTIKQIGDGKMTLQSVTSRMPAPMKIAITNAVTQYNPNFDETLMPQRRAAAVSFASGNDSKVIQAFNAAASHIYSARPMLEALNNSNYPLFNKLSQEWSYQTGNPVPTNADMIRSFLGNELTKAIAGYQNAEGDRKEMKAPFDKANSPAQLLSALDTAEEFAAGQLRSEAQKYQHATRLQDFSDMLVPEAKAILSKHPGAFAQSQKSAQDASVLPSQARQQLHAGVKTTFKVGSGTQTWTLDASSNPQRVQ